MPRDHTQEIFSRYARSYLHFPSPHKRKTLLVTIPHASHPNSLPRFDMSFVELHFSSGRTYPCGTYLQVNLVECMLLFPDDKFS